MKTLTKNTLFLLGIAFFLAGFINLIFLDKESNVKYQKIIQSNIDKETKLVQKEQERVLQVIQGNPSGSFEQYKLPLLTPYFIFKNDSLIYWSSNKNVPDYEYIKNKEQVSFYENNKSFSLLVKSTLNLNNQVFTVASFIGLYDGTSSKKNGFNFSLFKSIPATISSSAFTGTFSIKDSEGSILFYLKPVDSPQNLTLVASTFTLILFAIGILLICLYSILHIRILLKLRKYVLASVNLTLLVAFVRLFMFILGLPWKLLSNFNIPAYLIDSSGFGDLIISCLFTVLVLSFITIWQLKSLTGKHAFTKSKMLERNTISVSLVLVVVIVSYLLAYQIRSIYQSENIGLKYSMTFELTNFKIFSYVFLFCLFSIYFLINHLAINYFSKLNRNSRSGFFKWLYGALLSFLLAFALSNSQYWIVISSTLYFIIAYLLNFPRYIYILRFKTFIYFLFGAFSFTILMYGILLQQENAQNLKNKQEFTTKLLQKKNLKAEVMLNQLNHSIQKDSALANALKRPVFALENIKYIIKDSLLSPYFDSYDVEVFAYNKAGESLGYETDDNLIDLLKRYGIEKNKTDYEELFFINTNDQKKNYVMFSNIFRNERLVGTIVLKIGYDIADIANINGFHYPRSFSNEAASNDFSYALFDKNQKLIYSQGSFDYQNFSAKNQEWIKALSTSEHFVQFDKNGNFAVITQPSSLFRETLSNFSYLFLISILGIVFLLIVLGLVSKFKSYNLSFSSKIQFYLNLAFLVPLTIIILLTLAVVINSFINIQNRSLQDTSFNITNTIDLHYQNYQSGKSSKAFLVEQLNNLAKSANFDLNLYNNQGRLIYTSSPNYLNNTLVPPFINPDAYVSLLNKNRYEVLEHEQSGQLEHKTVYSNGIGISGEVYGIISIPYLDSKIILERQIKEVVSTILIIFFIMFFALLALSYTASTNLTKPLSLIAQKLKKTNLNAVNEKIAWKSNDEIGLLTTEYNRMVEKLEESKEALSVSEKQTAWREMARQVAHEIKNPLTPMKLSIQQLQRTLPTNDDLTRTKIERVLSSINEQIDNISEIANSFSEFAKMPVPRTEIFDLVSTVRSVIDLFSQNNNLQINFKTESDKILVSGDRMILSRAINNLILNGIQAVPDSRTANILVSVTNKADSGIVEVHDNGLGISEDVRKKVFIPNFSTKTGGSGLGLSMAKRGIEHAGGNIWFETSENEGTTFFLDLPIAKS